MEHFKPHEYQVNGTIEEWVKSAYNSMAPLPTSPTERLWRKLNSYQPIFYKDKLVAYMNVTRWKNANT